MPFIATNRLPTCEKGAGWRGRQFASQSMTFVHWTFEAGASVHEHSHPQEEVWEVLSGVLEVTIEGVSEVAGPGGVAIVPPDARHSVLARQAGTAIVVDHPLREPFG